MELTNEEKLKKKLKRCNIIKIITKIICIILLPIIAYNIFIMIKSIINPNDFPALFGIKAYVMKSESMKPDLEKRRYSSFKKSFRHQ